MDSWNAVKDHKEKRFDNSGEGTRMKNVVQRRKYSNIKFFNDTCATALHEAKERYVESLGATIRAGGEWEFIICSPQQKIEKNTRRLLRKASSINATKEERQPRIKENG